MAEYWIQLHDYSSTTHENISSREVKEVFRTFDWALELDRFVEDDPARNCPPGIGVRNGVPLTEAGAILLHICPLDSDSAFLNIHCSRPGKLLGIFARVDQTIHSVASIEISRVDELIDLVFSDDSESLLAVE